MRGRRVVGHDGRVWRIRRRWLPWQPRVRGRGVVDAADGAWFGAEVLDLDWFDSPLGVLAGIVAGVLAGLLLVLLLPVALTLLEVVLLVVLLPLTVVSRVVLRTPWSIVARTGGPPPEQRTEAVVGWRASAAAIRAIADGLSPGAPRAEAQAASSSRAAQ